MQALILCGGLGKRLRPLTRKIPKSMLPVAGKPFLEYLIKLLKQNGIKEIILCTGYLHNKLKDYFGDGEKFGVNIQYSREHFPLGTGGAIKNAEKLIKSRFFVLNGDSYINLNLKSL
ncbi:MAG: sugar phosphate nucleotidyltransferase, partial [candidate division Zixibacteria bacterium]|nr:sugar phosphate nucleotidyltransferase [candidate division Zixibacteria bacterium]